MELLPTLRAQLDVLEPYLVDETVHEILVAGPDRVFVTRQGRSERVQIDLPDRRIRSLADRLLRALGGRADRHDVRSGRLSPEFEVSVIGTPRGERCPVVRVHRRPAAVGLLSQLVQDGLLGPQVEAGLAEVIQARKSVVVVAPFGAPRAQLITALATAWRDQARVVALDSEDGALAESDAADLIFPAGVALEALMASAPDLVVTLDPAASVWTGLLSAGRPFLVAVEAPDGPSGLERLVALALAGDARLSRSAAEGLVLSCVASIVELGSGRRLWLRKLGRPQPVNGRVQFVVDLEQPAPPEPLRAASVTIAAAAKSSNPAAGPRSDSLAFPGADLVEALSNEIAEAEAALRGREVAPDPEATRPAPPVEPLEGVEPAAPAPAEERTRFMMDPAKPAASPPPIEAPPPSPVPRRMASERMATVTGPPRPSEVASQVAHVLDELSEELSGAFEPPEQDSLQDELMTSHVVTPPNLDPFETHEGPFEPGPMDSTQAAEISEMLSAEITADPRAFAIPAQPTMSRGPSRGSRTDDWDEDAPSELIQRPKLGAEVSAGEFEDEKTPVAPLFEAASGRTGRRARPRPHSSSDEELVEAPGDELGDPTRRRRDAPERPRGRRRQRDRS